MDFKDSIIIVMSTESKIFTGVLASALTGLLLALHIIDPSQAETVRGMLETGFGLLIALIAVAYGLETLLVKHKAEIADKHFLIDVPEAPNTPVTGIETTTPTP